MIPKEQASFITDTANFLKTKSGQEFLKYMKQVCHVEETLEPEEVYNKEMQSAGLPHRFPLDPLGLAKRSGMKSIYYKIIALLKQGERQIEASTNE